MPANLIWGSVFMLAAFIVLLLVINKTFDHLFVIEAQKKQLKNREYYAKNIADFRKYCPEITKRDFSKLKKFQKEIFDEINSIMEDHPDWIELRRPLSESDKQDQKAFEDLKKQYPEWVDEIDVEKEKIKRDRSEFERIAREHPEWL